MAQKLEDAKKVFRTILEALAACESDKAQRAKLLAESTESGLLYTLCACHSFLPPHYCELADVALDSTYAQVAYALQEEVNDAPPPDGFRH